MTDLFTFGLLPQYTMNSSGGYYAGNTALYVMGLILTAVLGYLLGSVNFALVISRVFYRDDIRRHGSGNAGMTNMLRTYGKKAAALTLLGDAAKTVIAAFLGSILIGTLGYGGYAGAFAVILGHIFPVFYGFKGGKGVVAAAMMVLCTSPITFAILLVMFVLIVATTKYLSLGSIIGMMIYPLILARIAGAGPHVLIAFAAAALIVFMHRSNIKRLFAGEESKFSLKSKKDKKEKNEENKK